MGILDRFKTVKEKLIKDKLEQELEKLNSLQDIIAYILSKMDEDSVNWIKNIDTVESFVGQAHFFLGMSIRNNLKLWEKGSHLYNFFNTTYDLTHADDMSGIILKKLYNTIHKIEGDDWIKDELASYKAHWERENKGGNYTITLNGKDIEIKK